MMLIIISLLPWIELCVGFFGIPDNIYPSNEDVSEAYNLTSWISNQTARELLRQYITICPGHDMCHGNRFIRQYVSDSSTVPACIPCDCDDSCVRKSTCCPSKFLHIENSSDTNGNIQENDSLNQVPLSCVQPLWNIEPKFDVQGYWLIKSCPNGEYCEPQERDINSCTPVTSISTNESYINMACALCNNENALNLIFWKQNQILCQHRADLLMMKIPENLYEMASHSSCNVLFYPPGTVAELIKPCTIVAMQNPCNSSGTLSNEMYLLHACDTYHLPYFNCHITYKNVFCALCVQLLPIQCAKDMMYSPNNFPMFSALIDFNEDRETVAAAHDRSCGVGQVYDKRLKKCLDVTCEAEYVLDENLECRSMYPEWGENNYEVNLIFRPTHDVDGVDKSRMPFQLRVFLENIMEQNNVSRHLCSTEIFVLVENGAYYLGALIELTINHGHDINTMIDKLTQIFCINHDISLSEPFSGSEMNISSSIIGQRFYLYEKSDIFLSKFYRKYLHPMTFRSIEFSFTSDFIATRRFCTKLPSTIVVTEWYRCPKVQITTEDVKIGLGNYSLCLVDHDHCIPSRYFKKALNNLQFDVCVDWYFRTSTQISSQQTSSDDVVNVYLSLVCLSLSSVGSIMTIISSLITTEPLKDPQINVIILSVFLIIANTIYTFSIFFQWSEALCVTVGMLVHFFWLYVVFWMSLCSFKVFETFTTFAVVKLRQSSDLFCRLIINLLLCLISVGTNIIVSHTVSDGQSFGYSPRTCYIEDSKMILYTFALPVGLTVCINTFMFVVTVGRIQDKGDVRKSKDHVKASAYFRLSTLTGMSWLFGFLAQFTNLQVFSFFSYGI